MHTFVVAISALAASASASATAASPPTAFSPVPPNRRRAASAATFLRDDSSAPRALVDPTTDDGAEEGGPNPSRRSFLSGAAGVAVSSALLGSPAFLAPASAATLNYGTDKRTVVVTGSNSGIGFDAASRMAARGHRVVLACRTLTKAKDAAERVASSVGRDDLDLIPAECDLASLDSVRSFVEYAKGSVGEIDALCLNAGLARDTSAKEVLRTKEGFELTVGTNHFGHFYLANLILPQVKRNTGRIVVTASGVHDPDSPGGAQGSKATLGDLSGLANGPYFDMVDGGPFDADKAYKDSKLCNVFFTRELQRRLDLGDTGIKVNCFNPGLIVGTGLFRDQNPLFTKVFDIAATNLLKVGESTSWGGGALEYMALDSTVGSKGGLYYTSPPGSSKYGEAAYGAQFTISEVSKEARDDIKGKALWDLSEKLIGVKAA